ncbi:MAG: hypothetical protein ACLRSG_07680 [Christensenellales bacterium]
MSIALICKEYGLSVDNIVNHREAHARLWSNHGDPDNWWKNFSYTMDMFRAAVSKARSTRQARRAAETLQDKTLYRVQTGLSAKSNIPPLPISSKPRH